MGSNNVIYANVSISPELLLEIGEDYMQFFKDAQFNSSVVASDVAHAIIQRDKVRQEKQLEKVKLNCCQREEIMATTFSNTMKKLENIFTKIIEESKTCPADCPSFRDYDGQEIFVDQCMRYIFNMTISPSICYPPEITGINIVGKYEVLCVYQKIKDCLFQRGFLIGEPQITFTTSGHQVLYQCQFDITIPSVQI